MTIRDPVLWLAVAVLLTLAVATHYRNRVWQSDVALWYDTSLKSPMKPRPRVNLARAYQEQGRNEDAIREYQNAMYLVMRPQYARYKILTHQLAAMNMSQILIGSGQLDLAEEVLVRVWNQEPGFPGIAINLALVYLQQSRFQMASEVVDAGLSQLPRYPWFGDVGKLYFVKGAAQDLLGDCPGALKNYQQAARLDADLIVPQVCNLPKEIQ